MSKSVVYVQGSVASFHFRNELSLRREGDLLGVEGEGARRQAASGGRRSWLRQAGMWAGRQAGRQADLAQAARLHVATVAEVEL